MASGMPEAKGKTPWKEIFPEDALNWASDMKPFGGMQPVALLDDNALRP